MEKKLNTCLDEVRAGTYSSITTHPHLRLGVYMPEDYDDCHLGNQAALDEWSNRGIYDHLDRLIRDDPSATKFSADILGNVSFDIELTGTVSTAGGDREITKDTRIFYMGDCKVGVHQNRHLVLLNATHDDNFIG